ncbi:MAG: GNAT family N-acetyltransferase [Halodesulfurarchaeum sp.]
MSVTIEISDVHPGEDDYLKPAWELKEDIRKAEDLLKQRWGFFADAYRRSRVFVIHDEETLVGFVAARRDGYILFLGIHPDYRGRGFGKRLVAKVADQSDTISCHARASNENALAFYEHLGFERVRKIEDYYEDGEDAYYLRLGDEDRLLDKISDFLRGS